MTDQQAIEFPWALFPLFFIGMWLAIGTLLGLVSGWFALQGRFPESDAQSRRTLRMRSGKLGAVYFSGCLTFYATPRGLRVRVWHLFAPFQRAFEVPWDQITATESASWIRTRVRLSLGKPSAATMRIDAHDWERLLAAAGKTSTTDRPTVSPRSRATPIVLQWLVVTAFAATFLYGVPRLMGAEEGVPLHIAILFPGIVFGIGTLIRLARLR
ncbi:hypothetical protein [Stakelama tenebrarum]|uniref:Uncharacterized protein n=1 Tax=Stakelama tenebrarum TaxID=2711215 RepID=A0A6G6Y8K6_9SPHN|nr:hypothetical protein [Sphingosinithalassobacter tenebrarum]QIG81181.1 hypothetical protein G5C33_16290 [Sphingosinithalassobacter tenebrarum]